MNKERKTTKDDGLLPIIKSLIEEQTKKGEVVYKTKDGYKTFEEIVEKAVVSYLKKREVKE